MISIMLRPRASSSTTSKRNGRAGCPVPGSLLSATACATLCLKPSKPGASRLVVHEPLRIHAEAGGIQERRERRPQSGGNEPANRPALLVHAGLLELEEVLHGDDGALH